MAAGTLTFAGVITYGLILLVNYCMNYLDNYPEKKLEYGIYLDFKLLSLRKISTIDYTEYQKIGTGKLVQRIENGSSAGRNVVFNFWLRLIRDLLPTIVFSVYFIWKIDKIITYILFVGYILIFIITNILLKFLYKIKEKILNSEELFNHFLVRGFMEMLVFRMSKQFPSEIKKTRSAKEDIVSSKVKMNMIHEAFFTIFALLVAMLDMLKMKDKTVIAIAHRLNSIAGFDRIILFREGKIVGQGTFEELLHTDSYFKELYNANVQ